jgi:murein hydrolase activator
VRLALFLLAMALSALPASLSAQSAQQDLRASQLRLDSIRTERERLQREMESLQSRVRDASRELTNLGRQRAASASALQELDYQAELLDGQVQQTQLELESTRHRLTDRSSAMRERLRSIYKRGPLHTVRVLLGADSFSDLLNRYKYLHLLTLYDRRVLDDVGRLERLLRSQEIQMEQTRAQMESLRAEKNAELQDLRQLENRSRSALGTYRQQETQVASAIDEAEKAEARLASIINALETARREEDARRRASGAAAAPNAISTRALGTLTWPVDGDVIYRFGPVRKPSGITLINKGIGIAAPAGSPVRVVEGGEVVLARPFEGYGRTVMVSHGGGYYTLYMYLRSIVVQSGQQVTASQVVGTVGGEETPEGAHLYFQVHAPVRGETPEPVDPLSWLRSRAGSP